MVRLEGKHASFAAGNGAVGYFVGVGTICLSTPAAKEAALMSIMTMASHGRREFHFLRVVCVVKLRSCGALDEVLIFVFRQICVSSTVER